MKRNFINLVIIFILMLTACNDQKKTTPVGVDPANLDTSAIPGDDFYQYACGGWMATHPLSPEYSRYGTFDALGEKSREQVKELIIALSQTQNEAGSSSRMIGDLYALAMDSTRLNEEGNGPIRSYLEKIEGISDKKELTETIAGMFKEQISPFFDHYVYADDKNSSMNIFHLTQGGTRMGDRDYYLAEDERAQELRQKYREMVAKLFTLSGTSAEEASRAAVAVLKLETQLARAARSRVELRDPEANYNKMTVTDLKKEVPALDWDLFFKEIGIDGIRDLNVAQPAAIIEAGKIIHDYPLDELKYYLKWNAILAASSYLSDDFSDATFEYYGKALSGKEQQQERWKRAVSIVNGCLGEAVGQVYVTQYFPPASKEKMLDLVRNLQISLGERIQALEWMSDVTKEKAMEKLGTFRVKIGYPDKWRDYSALNIDPELSYLENIARSNRFDYDYMIAKFNQSVDRDEWLMNPQTVNAYYNPATNEICFPAGILQPPFFDPEADDASNYGAIGVVIGHEMTHGFDDQGRKYDKEGNLTDWWTAEDTERFGVRAQVMVDFFNRIQVLDGVHANGELTLGENIADNGGLQVSWQAYQNSLHGKRVDPIDGFTDAQRFFLSYSAVWSGNIRDEEILNRTKTDPHSLGRWRVNGALPHIDGWYEAFGIDSENSMYLPKEERVAIW